MKPMFAYIPSNLDLNSEKHRDKYYLIITLIFSGRVFLQRKNSDSFIQLYSLFLKSVINGRYKEYIRDLIQIGVIETDDRYIKKTKSKAYRLTEEYRNVKKKRVKIEDDKIISKYWKYKAERKKKITVGQHKYLYKCLEQVEIDYEAAKDFLNKTVTDIKQFDYWNYSIDKIYNKDWDFAVDKTAGRLHNNITNLSKKLRPFLIYDCQKLIEIDISNCQPLLFNILISRYYLRYADCCGIYTPYVPQNSDIRHYRELTEQGRFYEFMMEELKIREDRALFKIRLFAKVFYGRDVESEELIKFKKIFPDVSDVIKHYKKVNYKYLSIELQKLEAEIMINSVVPRLLEKEVFLLTIHDSILTTSENVDTVRKAILFEFRKYNLNPTLKIKS
jgi:hypothetical protein